MVHKNNGMKRLIFLLTVYLLSIKAFAQYPTIPQDVQRSSDSLRRAAKKHPDAAGAWALPIIGEEATGVLLVRYSDDDYTTFSRYRQINLAQRKPALRGLGRFRRRVFEFRYTGNGLPRMTEAELTLGG